MAVHLCLLIEVFLESVYRNFALGVFIFEELDLRDVGHMFFVEIFLVGE